MISCTMKLIACAFLLAFVAIVIQNSFCEISQQDKHSIIKSLLRFIPSEKSTDNKYNAFKKFMLCETCRSTFFILKHLMHSETAIKLGATALCRIMRITQGSDCDGYANLFAPHLSYILKNSNLTASEMCGVLIGKKCLSSPPSMYETWRIPLPPPQSQQQMKQIESDVNASNLRVLHLSDFHFDPLYAPGAVTDCKEKICCRKMSTGHGSAGYWGHSFNCDAPIHLLRNLVNHLNKTHATDFDLLFWTGDNNPHDDWMTSTDSIIYTSTTVTNLLKNYLSENKAIFPILGNHEGMPANQFVLANNTKFDTQWLYDKLADQWSEWLATEEARKTFKIGGYYARKYNKQLKIISLNTNLCARINLWSLYAPIDPANQLQWFVNELKQSEDNSESVYILGHIAPDMECTPIWFHNYVRIIERFRETIKGSFFGHTHRDEFRLYYSSKNVTDAFHVGYIGPSVTTFNPGYRFYSLNNDYSVENMHSYYLNLTEANAAGKNATLNWRKSYDAKSQYGLKSFSPQEWDSFYHRLLGNDSLTQIYYKNVIRFSDSFSNTCNEKCKKYLILGPIAQHDNFGIN